MSKQAKGEPRTSSVVVENTLQKVSMEMSKLVEDLEDNVNILNGQKQQANATNNNNAANANKKPNATISNKNKNSANNKKAGSASSNNTSNAPQNRNRVLANRNKKNSYSSNSSPKSSFQGHPATNSIPSSKLPLSLNATGNASAKISNNINNTNKNNIFNKNPPIASVEMGFNPKPSVRMRSVFKVPETTANPTAEKLNFLSPAPERPKSVEPMKKRTVWNSQNRPKSVDGRPAVPPTNQNTPAGSHVVLPVTTNRNDNSSGGKHLKNRFFTNVSNKKRTFKKSNLDKSELTQHNDNTKSEKNKNKKNSNMNNKNGGVSSNENNPNNSQNNNLNNTSINKNTDSHNINNNNNSNNIGNNNSNNIGNNNNNRNNIGNNNNNNSNNIGNNNNNSNNIGKNNNNANNIGNNNNNSKNISNNNNSNNISNNINNINNISNNNNNNSNNISNNINNINNISNNNNNKNVIVSNNVKNNYNANFNERMKVLRNAVTNNYNKLRSTNYANKNNLNNANFPYAKSVVQPKSNVLARVEIHPAKIDVGFEPGRRQDFNLFEKFAQLKNKVAMAMRDKKTFTVIGNYYTVRNSLCARDWVEKIHISERLTNYPTLKFLDSKPLNELLTLLKTKEYGSSAEKMIMSKLLGRHPIDFHWDMGCGTNWDSWDESMKIPLQNNIKRGMLSYASKQGLCEAMKRSHWYQNPGISYILHPRSYTLSDANDHEQFIIDFKLTAAMSLLKWIVATSESSMPKLMSPSGKVPVSIFQFAVSEITKLMRRSKHEDIDCNIEDALDHEWSEFLENYYKIIHIGNHFTSSDLESEQTLISKSRYLLKRLEKYWPYLNTDGIMNIWILKPVGGGMGVGIHICRTLQYVMKVISENKNKRYVIQKYIERPLLIYNTKFDIRQWFLISSTVPLTIWMYKVCYLRFSSQTYNLRKLHESIHLTNNSVQTRYKNCNRDPNLPQHNMWDSVEFQKYLENSGYPNAWKNIIYPGMRQCFVAAVLLNQEYICARKNSFELYGADFMITEDFKPWLIEINSRPALHPSTPVTARLCPQVLEDVIKVVIDNARDPNAKTGQFEQIYKQKIPPLPKCNVDELKLEGTPLPSSYFCKPEEVKDLEPKINPSSGLIDINNTNSYMKYVRNEMRKTLEKLLTIIRTERSRRKKLKNLNSNASNTKAIKQQEIDKCNKNIDKGVECVLEIKDLMKHQEKSKDQLVGTDNVEKSNSSIQVDLIKELIGEDGSQEAEAIKDTLLKITETSDSTSSTAIFNDVLKLLSGLKKEEN